MGEWCGRPEVTAQIKGSDVCYCVGFGRPNILAMIASYWR